MNSPGDAHAETSKNPPNRLARESSPYLLQHAHNPVDWFAWGDEAFEEARKRDVPIFLSIGYATCYWCHVMERECFENDAIAAQLSANFVSVKVDREERPAVDELYMAATTITTGHGGWPMSVFLEPTTLKPFYCGTYFPASAMPGMSGRPTFPALLSAITELWQNNRAKALEQANVVAEAVKEQTGSPSRDGVAPLDSSTVADAASTLLRMFDQVDGGFSRSPKFPQPVFLQFLLDVRHVVDETTRGTIDHALRLTLDRMACGGIFDQVGGGFHRYSVDAHWIVPHFEKMLYDQAQLARVYGIASRVYSDDFYASIARRTIECVRRDFRGDATSGGAFFSALDAEVDSREGLNYLWTKAEVHAAFASLGAAADAAFACDIYGLDDGTNFKDPHHASEPPRNVLRLEARPERVAERLGISVSEFATKWARVNECLLAVRATRRQPRTDDKAIAAWNGLMIAALADVGRALNDDSMIADARGALDFVLNNLQHVAPNGDARLARAWRDGPAAAHAVLEDHATLFEAIAALTRAQPDSKRELLDHARELIAAIDRDFIAADGSLTDSPRDAKHLFVNTLSTHDGAMPSAVGTLLHALLDCGELTGDAAFARRAREILASISASVAAHPVATIQSTRALLRLLMSGEMAASDGTSHAAASAAHSVGSTGERTASRTGTQHDDFSPVEVYADLERVLVSEEIPGSLTIAVRIAPGYHLIAADPGAAVGGLLPFRVGIVHGKGIAAYADYPAGTDFGVPGAGTIKVYEGEIEVPIVLEVQGKIEGNPLLCVTFQACTNTECLAPRTLEIDVALDRA
jgi:uncharacterized protein YyaL (SSP411 family)